MQQPAQLRHYRQAETLNRILAPAKENTEAAGFSRAHFPPHPTSSGDNRKIWDVRDRLLGAWGLLEEILMPWVDRQQHGPSTGNKHVLAEGLKSEVRADVAGVFFFTFF